MRVQSVNISQYSYNFQRKNKVIDDGDFVKIPKEKYERDKIKENIIVVLLLLEIIHEVYKFITHNPPKI